MAGRDALRLFHGYITAYIKFWEDLWANGGLIFEGTHWHFELADLYIKIKQFDSAMDFILMIKSLKPQYASKADYYIEAIKKQKSKQQKNKKPISYNPPEKRTDDSKSRSSVHGSLCPWLKKLKLFRRQ